jgi:hypothetical protein
MLINPRRTYVRAVTGEEMSDKKEVSFTLRDTDTARRAMQRGAYRAAARKLRAWGKQNPRLLEAALLLEVEAASLTTRIPDSDDCFGTETVVITLGDPSNPTTT